jgi:phosphate transport system protein
MYRATVGLLAADQAVAEEVGQGDVEIDQLKDQVTERVYQLSARQAPVTTDLRLVVTALRVSAVRRSCSTTTTPCTNCIADSSR